MSERSAWVILLALLILVSPLEGQRIKLAKSRAELESRLHQDSLDAAAHYKVALASGTRSASMTPSGS